MTCMFPMRLEECICLYTLLARWTYHRAFVFWHWVCSARTSMEWMFREQKNSTRKREKKRNYLDAENKCQSRSRSSSSANIENMLDFNGNVPFSCIGRTVLNHHFLVMCNLFSIKFCFYLRFYRSLQINMPIHHTLHRFVVYSVCRLFGVSMYSLIDDTTKIREMLPHCVTRTKKKMIHLIYNCAH